MSTIITDDPATQEDPTVAQPAADGEQPDAPESEQAQVTKVQRIIKADKEFNQDAFKQMRADMKLAFRGYDDTWTEVQYKANFIGRHVKQKTAALYAKNPKATAARNERIDFTVWDENSKSLMLAFQIVQQAQLAVQQAAQLTAVSPPDPITGMVVPVPPQVPQGFAEAQALIADFQQGTAYQQLVDKIGRTLEILFARALRDQEPLDFKTAAKALVRRACTCGVGYVELGFVRQYGPRDGLSDELADARARLDHLRRLATEAVEGDIHIDDPEMAELEMGVAALQSEPEIVLREGLTFDFPEATKVIPDKLCKQLVGFVGARHLSIEYLFTCEEIEEMFPEADIKKGGYKGYGPDGSLLSGQAGQQIAIDFNGDDENGSERTDPHGEGLVCVWKHYDKMSGLVYYVADGHKKFLRPPAAPDVFVEKFWPLFALTFNAGENEDQLFPKSDVALLKDQQMEHNRSRQGMKEHRQAARPRWVTSKGLMDQEFREGMATAGPFSVTEVNKDPSTKIVDVMESIPVPGVDPNLYATEQFEQDRLLAVGMQEAGYGGISKATATESAIAANSTQSSDESSKDDLDSFLSAISRASSQILFREMSEEQVKKIVGPGAVWPQQSLAEIAGEVYLEVEAGSSGRPNQAVEIDNFMKIAPILFQIPGLDFTELAKEGIRRLGDRLDVNKFILAGAPSVVAANSAKQPAGPTPAADPNAQGAQGAQNAPQPAGQESPGTGPAFGSNQVSQPPPM